MVLLGIVLRRVMGDHEFQPLHRSQPALKSFASLDNVEHVGVVERLRSQDGVVGSGIEEWRFGEVGKYGVSVDAAHFLSLGRSPLYLIQRRLQRHGLEFVVKTDMWRVKTR